MATKRDDKAGGSGTEQSGGGLTSFLAEEEELDRRALWRLGSWAVGSVAALTLAIYATQSSVGPRHDQLASEDMTQHALQIQRVAKESQAEARRLALAIETLSGDRDRLYSRITTLEQGLDSVTGTIVRPPATAAAAAPAAAAEAPPAEPAASAQLDAKLEDAPPSAASPPAVALPADPPAAPEAAAPVASIPAAESPAMPALLDRTVAVAPAIPLMASRSMMAPPDPAAAKLLEFRPLAVETPATTASLGAATDLLQPEAAPEILVHRTEFGIDIGGANSIDGLRALWQRLSKSNKALAGLRPIIVLKERANAPGMQLRLVAGPLRDAAAAAKLCAGWTAGDRSCEATVFDGQRLDTSVAAPRPPRRRSSNAASTGTTTGSATSVAADAESAPAPAPKPSALSSFLGLR